MRDELWIAALSVPSGRWSDDDPGAGEAILADQWMAADLWTASGWWGSVEVGGCPLHAAAPLWLLVAAAVVTSAIGPTRLARKRRRD